MFMDFFEDEFYDENQVDEESKNKASDTEDGENTGI